MRKILTITIIILFSIKAYSASIDTLKPHYINNFSHAWGLLGFYTPFTESESIEYFTILTEEIERIDTSKNNEKAFYNSIDRIIDYSISMHRINTDSNINIGNYKTMHQDLFKWVSNSILSQENRNFFETIINKGYIVKDSASPLIPKIPNITQYNDPNIGSLLSNYKIADKYDALGFYVYFWNIANYFSPFPIHNRNADSLFYKYLSEFLYIDSLVIQNYSNLMLQVFADQMDSHIYTNLQNYPSRLNDFIHLKIMNTKAYVIELSTTFALNYNIKVGDNIISVNQHSLSNRIIEFEKYLRASNPSVTNYRIARKLLGISPKDSIVNLAISRNDSLINISINLNNIKAKPIVRDKFPDKFKILNDSVAYINIGKISSKEFAKYLHKSKGYKIIVFDCREYPTNLYKTSKWTKYLIQKNGLYLTTQEQVPYKPGFSYIDSFDILLNHLKINIIKSKKFHEDKKFYLIANEQTQSKGEFTLLYLKTITNGTVLGRNTAGVPSEVAILKFPNQINFYITIKKVFDKNGMLISGDGILPDIPVEKDIDNYEEILNLINSKQLK